jgi:two-component response regulator (ARR-B family)
MHEVKEIEGNDSCDDLQIFRNGCEGLEERGLFMRADSDSMRKRKDVDSADQDSSDGATVKKARVVWSVDLHQKFVNAVNQIGFDSESSKKS